MRRFRERRRLKPLICTYTVRPLFKVSKTTFEKNCFSAWASTLNMGLIKKG